MPRDLADLADENSLQQMPELASTKTLNSSAPAPEIETGYSKMLDESEPEPDSALKANTDIHPYTQTLSIADIESCIQLENAAFPPNERASPEKFQYRLQKCGELCMGIFTSQTNSTLPTADSSSPVTSQTPARKAILLGHIISTLTTNPVVHDSDMAIPTATNPDPSLGHKEDGRTLCIHSLAILPGYQGRKLGSTLMKAYLQRVESHKVADRVALIAHDHLVPFYERLGFVNKGQSEAQFGGGGWIDMVREFGAETA